MLAQVEPLIAGIDNDRIVIDPVGFEIINDPFQIVVHSFHATQIRFQIFLIGVANNLLVAMGLIQFFGPRPAAARHGVIPPRIAAADRGADKRDQLVLISARGDGAMIFAVTHIIRFGNRDIRQISFVPRRVLEVIVRRLEMQAEIKRFVRITFFLEPFQRRVRDAVGRMPLHPQPVLDIKLLPLEGLLAVGFKKHRIEIGSLTRQHLVIVERFRKGMQMPFADHCGLVACLF